MASIIPGYSYDIFISYRQKDNKHDGWVTEFVDNLKGELESTFKEEISVYFDINPHDGLLETHDVDASLKEKLKCLIFIPVISRTYCDPKSFAWEHEFKAFVEIASKDQFGLKVKLPNGNVASRMLPVRIHELADDDLKQCENIVGGFLRGIEFVYKEAGIDKPLAADDDEKKNLNKTRYRIQIIRVAHSIKELVEGIKISDPQADKPLGAPGGPVHDKPVESSLKQNVNSIIKNRILAISGTLALLIAAILVLYPHFSGGKFNSIKDSEGKISIAVMPFQNLTGDTTLSYFGKGISSLLINGLGNSSELAVCDDPTLAEAMNGEDINYAGLSPSQARALARKVNAEAYISGSYQGVQDRYLIMINLVSVENGKIIWTDKAEGNIRSSDYLEIADTICLKIKNYLEIKALEKNADFEFREAYPQSAEAYRYFINGMNMVLKNDYRTGIDNLKKSLSIDSTALAGFYLTYAYMYSNQIDSCLAVLKKIYPLRKKVPLNYQLWMDMWYACYFGNSIQDIARDCDLLAESGINTRLLWFDLGVTYHEFSRQFDKSVAAFKKVLEINKDRGSEWKFPLFYEYYGDDLHHLGRHEEELAVYNKGLSIFPYDRSILRRKAACLISQGDTVQGNECISLIRTSINESGLTEAAMETNLSNIYTWAGFPQRGEPHARRALNLAPKEFLYIINFAAVLIDHDVNVVEGTHFVSTALDSLSPEKNHDLYSALLVLKGVGKFKQGKYDEAVENLENGFKLFPTAFPDLQHYLPEARQSLLKAKSSI